MREKIRRPVLFLATVLAGSLLIVIDAPVLIILAGTFLAGSAALVLTGALPLSGLMPSRFRGKLRSGPGEKPEKKVSRPSATAKVAATRIDLSRLRSMAATFTASVRRMVDDARAPDHEKQREVETLDEMIERAIEGAVPELPAAPKRAVGGAVDPFAMLADLDVDTLEGLDIDGSGAIRQASADPERLGLLSDEEADAVSEILKAHQSDLDGLETSPDISQSVGADEPDPSLLGDIPDLAESGGNLSGMPDVGELTRELSALDDLDPAEIEIEDDDGEAGGNDVPDIPEPDPAAEEEEAEEFDMVSFASGGTMDDDLIAELKSDSKKKKFVEDASLLRELRGKRYDAQDLAAEMEEILSRMRPKD